MHFVIEKKSTWILNVLIGITLITLMAFNSDNPDYFHYMSRYTMKNYGGLEIGFGVINSFFHRVGLSFIEVRAIVYAIGTISIFYSVSKVTINLPFVMISYFLLGMCMDAILLRSYIATVIVILGIPRLVNGKRRDDIVFAALCSIASSIHISCLYYFLFLVCRHIKNTKKYFCFMTIGSSLLIMMTYAGITGRLIGQTIATNRRLSYTQSCVGMGFIIYLIGFSITVYLLLFVFRVRRYLSKRLALFELTEKRDAFIINMFITLIPILGLMCMNAIFFRVVRSMLIFLFSIVGNILKLYKYNTVAKMKIKIAYALWMLFMIVWLYGGAFEETYLYLFRSNLIWGNMK